MKNAILFLSILVGAAVHAQIGIGTTSPNPSSLLELQSSSKGLLIPRVSLLSTSATSLLVYNTSSINDIVPGFYYWDSVWKSFKTTSIPSSGPYWSVGGNTSSSAEFMGSVNYSPLQFKVNNNLFAKFHPTGGMVLGYGASANDNNSIAIGSNANASAANQATAIGPSSVASGYQSAAFGFGASSTNNSALALGYQSVASGYQSVALGNGAVSSAPGSIAIGNQATAIQDYSIILGSSGSSSTKVGIGTNTPDEKLHIVGSLKLVDGSQGNGFILTSDANGKARWQNQSNLKSFGDTYYNGSGQSVNQYNNITFGGLNASNGVTINADGITVTSAGTYKVTYKVTVSKTSGSTAVVPFYLYKNYSTLIPGSLSVITIGNNETTTITSSVIMALNAYDKVSVRSTVSDSTIVYQSNGVSLSLEVTL
jgi:hypothetical protein